MIKEGDTVFRYTDSPVSYSFAIARYDVKKVTACGAWLVRKYNNRVLEYPPPEPTWRKFTGNIKDFAQCSEYGAAKAYAKRKRAQIRLLEDKLLNANTRLREIQLFIKENWVTAGGLSCGHSQK